MKKIFTILLAALLILSCSISAYATEASPFVYHHDNTTVIFGEQTAFDAAERLEIVRLLSGEGEAVEPCGLACLFGHKYETETVVTVTHRVYDTAPRCLEETFNIKKCTRCDKTVTERIGFESIFCCD